MARIDVTNLYRRETPMEPVNRPRTMKPKRFEKLFSFLESADHLADYS